MDHCGADWNEQALGKAKSYLDYSAFSYTGLISQLEYEGFTAEQAAYGADNCNADWNEQAAKSAKSYLDYSSFSRDSLIDQLVYEGFTYEQAVYGVDAVGL
ncbi:MAG: Ltp family lipoprotein [Neglectibacter timonensis]